jgi:hypothetical protein
MVKASAVAQPAQTGISEKSSTSKNPCHGHPPCSAAADPPVPPKDSQPTLAAAPAKKTKKGQAANKNADGVWAAMEEDNARAMAERSAQAVRHVSDSYYTM